MDRHIPSNRTRREFLTASLMVPATLALGARRARAQTRQLAPTPASRNAGYRLRGHQFTDDEGRYRLETIVPGLYPGRTRHFHVKVQARYRSILTTQLYFPGEPWNQRDQIFAPALLLKVEEARDGKRATFDFVLVAG